MLVKTFGSAVHGIDAALITVEVNVGTGVNFFLVGLPDSAIKESQQRIDAALKNNGYRIPGKNITINMAPADIRKEGSAYDLTIAIGILAASEQIKADKVSDYVIMGELSLDGGLQPIKGVLPIAINARTQGIKGIILPEQNAREAAIVEGLSVYGIKNIKQAIDFLNGEIELEPVIINAKESFYTQLTLSDVDFADVKGQENIKRSLEIAAAGGHNVLLIGPPGGRKNYACQKAANHITAFNPGGSPGNHQNTFGSRKNWHRQRTYIYTPLPRPAPYHKRCSSCGRRRIPPTGGDIAGA